MVLEKTSETPLDRKEIQSVHPKGNQPEYSFEALMLKLKLQYFGHLMQRADSLEKTLMLGKIEAEIPPSSRDEGLRLLHCRQILFRYLRLWHPVLSLHGI